MWDCDAEAEEDAEEESDNTSPLGWRPLVILAGPPPGLVAPGGVAEAVDDVLDQSTALQSSSFMAERIKKADWIVSSRCFWPSTASSCVDL